MAPGGTTVSLRKLLPALSAAAALALVACNGPTGFFSGGKLDGESRPVPTDWQLGEPHGIAQLETRSSDPYSVNIAFTVIDGRLYINAGDTETRWVQNIDEDAAVRLRVDGAVYEASAVRVTDREEIRAFGEAWTSQSSFYRDPSELEEVWVYRLEPRRP